MAAMRRAGEVKGGGGMPRDVSVRVPESLIDDPYLVH